MKDKPLISFVLGCYNQEEFIREAVAGALAQTYSPLEIIISDDCSQDRTFEIAREIVAGYKGPHSVRVNRNEINIGNGANVNQVMDQCRGELIVVAAGDDVSLPHRTEATYQAWEKSGRKATSICSTYTTISGDGTVLGSGGFRGDPNDPRPLKRLEGDLSKFLSTRMPAACGCSHAWSPEVFRYFGPLKSDLEDLVISFRSLAIGQIFHIREPLVMYRRHGRNVSFFAGGEDSTSFAHRESRLRWVDEQTKRAYDNMLADIEILHGKGRLTASEYARLKKEGQRIGSFYAIERQLMEEGFFKRLLTFAGAVGNGNFRAVRLAPRLLPQSIYRALYLYKNRREAAFQNGSLAASRPT